MGDNDILFIRNGDVSCIFDMNTNQFVLVVSRFGEMGSYNFNDWDELVSYLKTAYYFDDELIEEFKGIVRFCRV